MNLDEIGKSRLFVTEKLRRDVGIEDVPDAAPVILFDRGDIVARPVEDFLDRGILENIQKRRQCFRRKSDCVDDPFLRPVRNLDDADALLVGVKAVCFGVDGENRRAANFIAGCGERGKSIDDQAVYSSL